MMNRLASNAALLLGARTLSKILVLMTIIITQRALGATGYGEFATVIVLGNVSSILADLGVQVVFVREASRERDRLGHLLGVTLAAKVPLAVAGGLLLLALVQGFAPDLMSLALPTYVLVVITGTGNVIRSCFFAEGELRYEACAIALETATLVAATVGAAATHQGAAAYIWAYAASYAVPLVFAAAVVSRRYARIRLHWDHPALRRVIRQSLPFAVAFILNTLYFRIDVVILHQLRPVEQVGYYSAAVKFIDGLTFIPQAIMNALFPTLSVLHNQGGTGLRDTYARAYRVLGALGMPASVGIFVLAPAIISATGALGQSASSLRILGISVFFIFVVNSFLYVLGAMNRQLVFAWITGISVVVNVVLNLILIPMFPHDRGYDAAAWTTVITEVFLFAIGYVALVRALGHFPWIRPAAPILAGGTAMLAVMWPLQSHPIFAALAGSCVYVAAMLLAGGISKGEIRLARSLVAGLR